MLIYGDGIEPSKMSEYREILDGFTTNPSLAKKLGVTDYFGYCVESANQSGGLEVSVEVLADDENGILYQARKLSAIGENVFVKIPAVKTNGDSNIPLINALLSEGIRINIPAVFHLEDVDGLNTDNSQNIIISVFAGRIADIRLNPEPLIKAFVERFSSFPQVRVLWASTREVYNIIQAQLCNVDIITVTEDVLKKYLKYSSWNSKKIQLDTVQMFFSDALDSGFSLD